VYVKHSLLPKLRAELMADGRVVGQITSAVWSPWCSAPLAFAIFRRVYNQPGATLKPFTYSSKAAVVDSGWLKSAARSARTIEGPSGGDAYSVAVTPPFFSLIRFLERALDSTSYRIRGCPCNIAEWSKPGEVCP